jgi:hypothetical protein
MSVDRTNTYYAAEGGKIGYGAQLMLGDGASPEGFDAIFGVRNIQLGDTNIEDVDLTHLRSQNAHREHAPGMMDTDVFTITGIYKPDEWSLSTAGGGAGAFASGGLPYLRNQRGIHNWTIALPFGSPAEEVVFRGYISGFSLGDITQDNVIEYTLTIQPTQSFTLP